MSSMSADAGSARPGPGRPRLKAGADDGVAPREQILEAAAELFVERGFAATSTRMIADKVGLRQASMYYHFAGKDEIVIELLATSVRPSLEALAALPDSISPAAALYALALADVGTLASTTHNVGILYLLPELRDERYAAFHADRAQLQAAYGRLGLASASAAVAESATEDTLGALLIGAVEVVISLRRTGTLPKDIAPTVADSCLRLCGLDDSAIAASRAEATPQPVI